MGRSPLPAKLYRPFRKTFRAGICREPTASLNPLSDLPGLAHLPQHGGKPRGATHSAKPGLEPAHTGCVVKLIMGEWQDHLRHTRSETL